MFFTGRTGEVKNFSYQGKEFPQLQPESFKPNLNQIVSAFSGLAHLTASVTH
jgi:hypothetical protein